MAINKEAADKKAVLERRLNKLITYHRFIRAQLRYAENSFYRCFPASATWPCNLCSVCHIPFTSRDLTETTKKIRELKRVKEWFGNGYCSKECFAKDQLRRSRLDELIAYMERMLEGDIISPAPISNSSKRYWRKKIGQAA